VETEKPSLTFTASGDEPTDVKDYFHRITKKNEAARRTRYEATDKRKEAMREYNASREQSRSGGFARLSSKHGQFVAIDSEGLNRGAPFKKDDATMQDQRTCLWMAGGVDGIPNAELVNIETGLSSNEILEFLASLPRLFYNRINQYKGHTPYKAKFVSFGFSYDNAQIVKDFPYEKLWELQNGKPYSQRDNHNFIGDLRAYPVLYGNYAIYIIPRKMTTIFRLRDPAKPFKDKPGKDRKRELNYSDQITIYDAHGFFQQRLTSAIEEMPSVVTEDELKTIKTWKEHRGAFKPEEIEGIRKYTALELKALVNMMTSLRNSLRTAIKNKPIELRDWYGAGAIARALLESYLGKEARDHLGDIETPTPWRECVLCAYFGARIDMVKSGYYIGLIFEYDITSAYPSICVDLPSMKGGRWERRENPTREEIENASAVSMFEVKTHNYARDLPFYALPYRTPEGSIMFRGDVWGWYMRDHVIAAFKHFDRFKQLGRIGDDASIELIAAWFFIPITDEKPLAWVKFLFDYRLELIKQGRKSEAQVIKLGINAIYGKFAQRIGRRGKPPKFNSLWYAAAITAGTQRRLIEAALTKPDAIIAFATDGIYSTEELDIPIAPVKTLGAWEMGTGEEGAFIQSGVYTIHMNTKNGKVDKKVKSRGFTPQNLSKQEGETYKDALDRTMRKDIPAMWETGEDKYSFEYQSYMTIGQCSVSRNASQYIGMWKKAPRDLNLNQMSNKREVPGQTAHAAAIEALAKAAETGEKMSKKLRARLEKLAGGLKKKDVIVSKNRAHGLIALPVKHLLFNEVLSAPSKQDWISEQNRLERQYDEDNDNIACGMS
jgi:hypothetical protein